MSPPRSAAVGMYLVLVSIALVLAAVRLRSSTEMPGLAAIELVLLAMPWSLALGVEPLSHWGWPAMFVIVLGGLILNTLIVGTLASWRRRAAVHANAGRRREH